MNIKQRWQKLSITRKFSGAFGIFLALILLVAGAGYISLQVVYNEVETRIVASTDIRRIVLEMNYRLEKARRLEGDFFLRYPEIGLEGARQLYAQPALEQIRQTIDLSTDLSQRIANSNVGVILQQSNVNLNLYLSSAKRNVDIFNQAIELVSTKETELKSQLTQNSDDLRKIFEVPSDESDKLLDLQRDMIAKEKDYLVTRQRPFMQSALNIAADLEQAIQTDETLSDNERKQALTYLTNYQNTAGKIVEIDTAIRSKFNDFDLQGQTIDPISGQLIKAVEEDVTLSMEQIIFSLLVNRIILGVMAVVGLLLTVIIAVALNDSITRNIVKLTAVVGELQSGNLNVRAQINSVDELGQLADGFNGMAERLKMMIDTLEQKVKERTERLETLALLGGHLNAILDFDQLLNELVNQVKERFNYYHVHIYILDEKGQNLVMQAGYGEVGAEMKAAGHAISLHAPFSLVARTARESDIVMTENVHQDTTWLPNPLLPNTQAEMAVPIIIAEKVVGVLDVQSDKVGGLDDSDASLLRSLANQVAVALSNARLFEQVEQRAAELAQSIQAMEAAKEQLQNSEKRFRVLYEGSYDALGLIDKDKGYFDCNARTLEIFGFSSKEEFFTMHPVKLSPPFQPNGQASDMAAQKKFKLALEQGSCQFEWFHRRKNGAEFLAEVLLQSFEFEGQPIFQANVRDITTRKQAEAERERLLEEATTFRQLVEFSGQGVGMATLEGKILYGNSTLHRFLGETDLVGQVNQTFLAYYSAMFQQKLQLEVLPAVMSNGQWTGELALCSKDGKITPTIENFFLIRDQANNPRYLGDMITDITAQKQAELTLQQAKESAEIAKDEAMRAKKETETAGQLMEKQIWLSNGQAELNDKMRGQQDIATLASKVIQQLCKYLHAQIGTLYIMENEVLKLMGSYAYSRRKNLSNQFKIGEGLVGQAALERQTITLTQIPHDYIAITSGLVEIFPRDLIVSPFLYEDKVVGVVEMATLNEFTPIEVEFVQAAMENIAIVFNTAHARNRIDELLGETRIKAEELQVQGEELKVANEELEAQTNSLRTSEAKLKENQQKLEITNVELEEKASALEESTAALEEKQSAIDKQNKELKVAQRELEQKAEDLTLASKYKSEFLANMSHELRTPLNSLLILARMLANNEEGNLSADQIESAKIIYSGGVDLLNLINEILDLAKVESGKMTFTFEPMPLVDLINMVKLQFTHVAEQKEFDFNISVADDLPETIVTDQQRVKQIVKNLLSNSFKFTEKGSVNLSLYRPKANVDLSRSNLDPAQVIAISVADTGIGMTPAQQKVVFEAFQQADGSTSRQYGGTGLGLSISRELANKLGGQISLQSEVGKGSTFTLYLPIGSQELGIRNEELRITNTESVIRNSQFVIPRVVASVADYKSATSENPLIQNQKSEIKNSYVPDDRDNLGDEKFLLVIEDDPKFAKIVGNFAHRKGFKCLIAGDGETGLQLVKTYHPHGIILDLKLPRMSGWEVLEALKNNPDTRHIPVHIMSVDDETMDAYKKGAIGYVTKPVSQENLDNAFIKMELFMSNDIKTLLLVEDDENLRYSVKKLLGGSDVKITEASKGQTALDLLRSQHFDCMILDLTLPDMTGFELLNKINEDETISRCPVIVYTGKALDEKETQELLKYADSVIVKGVKSPERLLDETALFLHRVVADMSADKQQAIKQLYDKEAHLNGKKILIADDDARNSFALSKLLADKGLKVHIAQNGQKALELLEKTADIDLVLMDIMMPIMDGFETIKRIRAQAKFRNLPILALTAKAMTGDREKCMAAGANDYLTKPIDPDRLFSMLRVWLYQ